MSDTGLNKKVLCRRQSQRQQGLTLLEIILALFISSFILVGIVQTFISTKQSYRMQDNMGRLQENGRFAAEYLSRDLRMSGYAGCVSIKSKETLTSTVNPNGDGSEHFLARYLVPLEGFEGSSGSWSPALSTAMMKNASNAIVTFNPPVAPVAGTDIITVRTVGERYPLTAAMLFSNDNPLQITSGNSLQRYDFVIVSNCEAAAIMQVTNNNPGGGNVGHGAGSAHTPGNSSRDLGSQFSTDATLYRTAVKTFYIATGSDGRPALWELNNSIALNTDSSDTTPDNPRELIAGVQDMQILYGIDDDQSDDEGFGTAERFVTADNVPDADSDNEWERVVSVRISLLLQTAEDNLIPQPQQYTYNGQVVTNPGDRRMRRVFTTTIGIRNRLP